MQISKAKGRIATIPAPRQAASEPDLLHHEEPGAASSYTESVVLTGNLPLTAPEPQAALTDRPSILIFTPRPRSITTGAPQRSATLSARLYKCALNRALARSPRRAR